MWKKVFISVIPSVVVALFLILTLILGGNACVFKNTLGVPCPGCGMTRAFISLAKLDVKAAFYYHPLFILPAVIAFIILFRNHKTVAMLYNSKMLWLVLSAVFILVWIVRMALMFPDYPPMDFNREAILFRLISAIFGDASF